MSDATYFSDVQQEEEESQGASVLVSETAQAVESPAGQHSSVGAKHPFGEHSVTVVVLPA